jgi:hypothetical protein
MVYWNGVTLTNLIIKLVCKYNNDFKQAYLNILVFQRNIFLHCHCILKCIVLLGGTWDKKYQKYKYFDSHIIRWGNACPAVSLWIILDITGINFKNRFQWVVLCSRTITFLAQFFSYCPLCLFPVFCLEYQSKISETA